MEEEFEEIGSPGREDKEVIEELEKYVEEEIEDIEAIEDRVAHEIAIHHRDLHTSIKTGIKKLENGLEKIKVLERSDIPQEEAVKVYSEIFEDIRKVDEEFTITILTTIAILRYVAQYYLIRKKLSEYFEKVGESLGEETARIREVDARIKQQVDSIVIPLAKATHSHIPPGALIKAAQALESILKEEGVNSWVTRRRAGLKKTAAKEERIA